MKDSYDLIIIGLGPAGMTAGIYASRYKLDTLVIGSKKGGMLSWSHLIDNVPGFGEISGEDLADKFFNHLKKYDNCDILESNINAIQNINNKILISTDDGKMIQGKSLILALGTDKKRANIKGEAEFLGRGVSYCTICDAMFYKNKKVAIIGSGDSAVKGALYLSDIAEKVYVVIRKEIFSCKERCDVDSISKRENIKTLHNSIVTEISGDKKVEKMVVETYTDDNVIKQEIDIDGIFIEIGTIPQSVLLNGLGVELDENGFIKIDNECKTNINNIFAAGDITVGFSTLKQIVVASAMGAIAATSAKKFLTQ